MEETENQSSKGFTEDPYNPNLEKRIVESLNIVNTFRTVDDKKITVPYFIENKTENYLIKTVRLGYDCTTVRYKYDKRTFELIDKEEDLVFFDEEELDTPLEDILGEFEFAIYLDTDDGKNNTNVHIVYEDKIIKADAGLVLGTFDFNTREEGIYVFNCTLVFYNDAQNMYSQGIKKEIVKLSDLKLRLFLEKMEDIEDYCEFANRTYTKVIPLKIFILYKLTTIITNSNENFTYHDLFLLKPNGVEIESYESIAYEDADTIYNYFTVSPETFKVVE